MFLRQNILTFSHRLDEAALVWKLQKLVCNKFDNFALFQHSGDILTWTEHAATETSLK